jgi:asparagine synthase (glutamine-hydrolysing)
MGGFNGVAGPNAPLHAFLGDDTHGKYISPQVCLVYTGAASERFAPQPVRGVLGQRAYVLACDGELYNKQELIKELHTLGYRFADRSDAAVILHGCMAWGAACLDKLEGVYAFALWDGEQLLLGRDRLGLKSLFYSLGESGLLFASHISALLDRPGAKNAIAPEGVAELLLLGPGRTPGSGIVKGIRELKPGHYMQYRIGGELKETLYWQLKAVPHREDFGETVEAVRALVTEAVNRQSLISADSAKIIMLSGGLDSSIIAALAKSRETTSLDYVGNDKHFIPNGFEPESDAEYIGEMVSFLRSRHRRHVIGTDELADALLPAMEARGLPGMGDIDAAFLLFCKNIRASAPVAFSGEGADEIFGGYPWFTDEEIRNADTFPWSRSLEYRLSFLHSANKARNGPQEYIRARYEEALNQAPNLYDDDPTDKRIRQLFLLSLQWFLQTLASRTECMGKAAGLVVRTPFLDHHLVAYMYNVPWEYKYHGDREKGLLRAAFKGLLPESVLLRKKAPFPKTHNPAYPRKVRDMMKDVLEASNAPLFQIVERERVKAMLDDTENGPSQPWYGQLMALPQTIAYFLQINAWLERYSIEIIE